MQIESEQDLLGMKAVGAVVRDTLAAMRAAVAPGMTTAELDQVAARVMERAGARSAPKLVYDFPGATCISVNDEIVHGIPSEARRLAEGDLVKLDVTAELQGYMADACVTVGVGRIRESGRQLIDAAQSAFKKGLRAVRHGTRVVDVGRVVEEEVTAKGFSVVRPLQGHGIGRTIHEDPMMPNWADPQAEGWLTDGLVITLEPIIAAGSGDMVEDDDGWTVRTKDGSLAAHHEHTLVVTKGAPLLLTAD
jgi:methionyl aminopeptidase